MHQTNVEPGLVGQVEDERYARLQHRRADRAFSHHLGGELAVDPVAFGEEQALGEGKHLPPADARQTSAPLRTYLG